MTTFMDIGLAVVAFHWHPAGKAGTGVLPFKARVGVQTPSGIAKLTGLGGWVTERETVFTPGVLQLTVLGPGPVVVAPVPPAKFQAYVALAGGAGLPVNVKVVF